MLSKILIAIVIALVVGYALFKARGDVSSDEAHRLVQKGARLVDVRTPQEFATGHIPGAVNIPLQELERRMPELDGKDRPIVVYCRSGNRSSNAARMLEKAGYTDIHNLGAMTRW